MSVLRALIRWAKELKRAILPPDADYLDFVDPDGRINGLLEPWKFRRRHKGEEGWNYPFDPGPPYTKPMRYR